jgi:hypothetical protein
LAVAVYVPGVALLFKFAPLGMTELAAALGAGVAGVAWFEIWKLFRRRAAILTPV